MIRPGVQFKPVEGDTLLTNRNHGEARAHLGVEAVSVHAEIKRRVPETDQPREQPGGVIRAVAHRRWSGSRLVIASSRTDWHGSIIRRADGNAVIAPLLEGLTV